MNALHELFFDQLRELHEMETRLGTELPPLGRLATDPRLASIIDRQGEDTANQYQALVAILSFHDEIPGNCNDAAMRAMLEGGRHHVEFLDDTTARDISLVGHCLRICHHQIASLVMSRRLSLRLGWNEEAGILQNLMDREILTAEELLILEEEI
jgi:ferritin-like metal-binding protein YciE